MITGRGNLIHCCCLEKLGVIGGCIGVYTNHFNLLPKVNAIQLQLSAQNHQPSFTHFSMQLNTCKHILYVSDVVGSTSSSCAPYRSTNGSQQAYHDVPDTFRILFSDASDFLRVSIISATCVAYRSHMASTTWPRRSTEHSASAVHHRLFELIE